MDFSFELADVTRKPYHHCPVSAGRLRVGKRTLRAVLPGSSIHQIRGLACEETLAVGRLIGQRVPELCSGK